MDDAPDLPRACSLRQHRKHLPILSRTTGLLAVVAAAAHPDHHSWLLTARARLPC